MTNEKTQETNQMGPLEDHIKIIVERVIQEREIDLAVEDVKIIIKEMMPDLDRMISRKVKEHFYLMGLFLMETYKTEE